MQNKNKKVFFLRNQHDLARSVAAINKIEPTKEKPYVVQVSLEDESRSNKQNRLSFLWYKEIGLANGHGHDYERRRCKLSYGIPILREDKEFNEFYQQALSGLTYEQKIKAMEFVPVTSLMTTKQFAAYLDAIDQESALNGIVLSQPEDLYAAALMRDL